MQQLNGWKALVSALAIFAATLASFVPVNAGVGFGDVPAGRFYTNAVHWMIEEEITFGTAPGCFQPSAPATRGQVATFTTGSRTSRMEPQSHSLTLNPATSLPTPSRGCSVRESPLASRPPVLHPIGL